MAAATRPKKSPKSEKSSKKDVAQVRKFRARSPRKQRRKMPYVKEYLTDIKPIPNIQSPDLIPEVAIHDREKGAINILCQGDATLTATLCCQCGFF